MIKVTKRQKDILDLLCLTGETDKYIANKLGIQITSVKAYLRWIRNELAYRTKTKANNRLQLVLAMQKEGYELKDKRRR